MALTYKKKWGVALLVVGLVLIAAGVAVYVALPQAVDRLVDAQRTTYTPEESQSEYDDFAATPSTGLFYGFYLFNISNCATFTAGNAKPVFERVGPFVYEGIQTKVNISFTSDNLLVSYKTWINYTFVEAESTTAVALDDTLCTLNIGYIAALAQAPDASEDTFMLSLMSGLVENISGSLIPLVSTLVQSSLVSRGCEPTGLPAGFAQVTDGVMASVAQQLEPLATVLSNNTNSFPVQFMQQAFGTLPSQLKASIFNANAAVGITISPLVLLSQLFLDFFVAQTTYGAVALQLPTYLTNGTSPAYETDLLLFEQLSLDDQRLLLCEASLSALAVCQLRALATHSAEFDGISAEGKGVIGVVYASVAASLVDSIKLLSATPEVATIDDIGVVQFLNVGVQGSPVLLPVLPVGVPAGTPRVLRPLELGAVVESGTVTFTTAKTALLTFIALAAPFTGEAAFTEGGLPATYDSYLRDWLFTELILPGLLDSSLSNQWLAAVEPAIRATYKRSTAYAARAAAAAPFYSAAAEIVQVNGDAYQVTVQLKWSDLSGLTSSGYELALATSADMQRGLCTTSTLDPRMFSLTSYLDQALTFATASGSLTVTATVPVANLTSLPTRPLLVMSGPGGDWTSAYKMPLLSGGLFVSQGFCAPVLTTGSFEKIYRTFFDVSATTLSFATASIILDMQYPTQRPATFGATLGAWQVVYGVPVANIPQLGSNPIIPTVYTVLRTAIFSTVFPAAVLGAYGEYLPAVGSGPTMYATFFDQLFNIQIGTALALGGASLKDQESAPPSIQLLPFYPEIALQSASFTPIPGGFQTGDTRVLLRYDQVQKLLDVILSQSARTSWRADPLAYFSTYAEEEQTAASKYLQYAVNLVTASAWLGQLLPEEEGPVAYPPTSLVGVIQSPVSAMQFLLNFNDEETCQAYLSLTGLSNATLLPFATTPQQLEAVVQPYLTSLQLVVYNEARNTGGLGPATSMTEGLDDFFYLQLGTDFLTSALGLGGSLSFRSAAQGIVLGLPLPVPISLETQAAAAGLLALLGDYELELWAAAPNAPFEGPAWSPFGVPVLGFPNSTTVTVTAAEARDVWTLLRLPTAQLAALLPAIAQAPSNPAAVAPMFAAAGFTSIAANTEKLGVVTYYLHYIAVQLGANLFSTPVLTPEAFAVTSNLVVKRTVRELIEGKLDPLIALSDPSRAFVGFNVQTTLASVQASGGSYYTYYTRGEQIGLLQSYGGRTKTVAWLTEQTIDGTSDGTSVPPRFDNSTLNVYVSLLDRVVSLVANGTSSVRGIATRRYALDVSQLAAAATDDVTIDGILSLGDIPGQFYNTKIFAGLPMFCGVDLSSFDAGLELVGAQEGCDTELSTFVDVEPRTGLVFNATQQLQISTVLDPAKHGVLNAWLGETTDSTYAAPLFYQRIYRALSQDQADAFNGTVGAAATAALAVLIVLETLGGVMVLIALMLFLSKPSDDVLQSVPSNDMEMSDK